MSQEWLDIQSFFADQDILTAINDLAIAVKLEAAGKDDAERRERAEAARGVLRAFLSRLDEAECSRRDYEPTVEVDPRFRELSDAFASARRDSANFKSDLMRKGAGEAISLLDADDPRSRHALLQSLEELRRIVMRHQQSDVSAIFEDF
jgi:hypothetical protein